MTVTAQDLSYQSGFANHFESESLPGALPKGQNSPQKAPYGLVAELLSGTAFTAPRHENRRTWLYRIRPSVLHSSYRPIVQEHWLSAPNSDAQSIPDQLRWDPLPSLGKEKRDFFEGVTSFLLSGSVSGKSGSAVHLYRCNQSMDNRWFCNADGDLLIVPQLGQILVETELGRLHVEPQEIVIVPRGIKFQVNPIDKQAHGYLLELYGRAFELPQLGPIGSNGLANPRDFLAPVAAYQDVDQQSLCLLTKYNGRFFEAELDHCPADVVAWHGNYYPYKYDLRRFNTMNTVSFDHPDPSIFTVLTSPSGQPGVANVDFVIFPPRWMVAENTFRPPYYHRNIMSEYMGLIHGVYDAKPAGGFEPGGGSLHSCMSAHGPEAAAYKAALEVELKPEYQADTLAFMFETSLVYELCPFALETTALQKDYLSCWQGIPKTFDPDCR